MRHAPPVSILVGRSRFGSVALAAAWLTGLLAMVTWAWLSSGSRGWQGAMAVLLAAGGAWAWHSVRAAPRGLLDWDPAAWGPCWQWHTAQGACAARVAVAFDLQRWLLVRLEPADGSGVQWLWLGPSRDEAHWLAVRRALYSRGFEQALPERPGSLP